VRVGENRLLLKIFWKIQKNQIVVNKKIVNQFKAQAVLALVFSANLIKVRRPVYLRSPLRSPPWSSLL
jgi:hypothetical protein